MQTKAGLGHYIKLNFPAILGLRFGFESGIAIRVQVWGSAHSYLLCKEAMFLVAFVCLSVC